MTTNPEKPMTLEQSWKELSARFEAAAPPEVLSLMKSTFFAGALTAVNVVIKTIRSGDAQSTLRPTLFGMAAECGQHASKSAMAAAE